MPSDYQPPPFSLPRLIKAKDQPSFEAICNKVLQVPGENKVYTYIRDYNGKMMGYDAYDISITVANLKRRGLLVDYGTEMDDKACRDYIIIREAPVELHAEAKKL